MNKVNKIIALFQANYPAPKCSLSYANAMELLFATILSAQCTDERVNKVTNRLFQKYRTLDDYVRVPIEELEQDIRSTGFYRNKAKSIKTSAEKILNDFGGEVPADMDKLLTLTGVARKTANVVLGNAFAIVSGIVVDTHVTRLAQRLGLTKSNNPLRIEKDLMETVPKSEWINFSHWLIIHGRKVCKARKPMCAQCFLAQLCPFPQ